MREYTYDWNPEWNEDETKPVLKISKSSLGSFMWCPKKYYYNYIERLPQDQTEAMRKGTIVHNAREDFFNVFDIKKAETLSHGELVDYCVSLHPIDEYHDMYETMSVFEANRFLDAKKAGTVGEFLPPGNEVLLDADIEVDGIHIHLQGIIDRLFVENGGYIPMELKTGLWKDYKSTSMRKEMAFYKLLLDNATPELKIEKGLDPDMEMTHWGWYYPASHYVTVEPVKKRTETAVMDNIRSLVEAYQSGLFPTKYFAKTCSSCSYFNICDATNSPESWL
tara:strand:- start:738 stop:1574 length:837 start_codon:yes stop_codon:yes gene_type:complete